MADNRLRDFDVVKNLYEKKDLDGLLKGLGHWDSDVRRHSAHYLGELGDIKATEKLIEAIKNDEKTRVKDWALEALGKIGDKRGVKVILKHAKDKEWPTRRTVAEALGTLGGVQGVNTLERLTKDKKDDVRLAAIHALGEIHDTQAARLLVRVWKKNHKKNVREAALAQSALSRITAESSEIYGQVVKSCKELESSIAKPA